MFMAGGIRWGAIGIDLGATSIRVAVAGHEGAEAVFAHRLPAAVHFAPSGVSLGARAEARAVAQPDAVLLGTASLLASPRVRVGARERASDGVLASYLAAATRSTATAVGPLPGRVGFAAREDLRASPAREVVARATERLGLVSLATCTPAVAAAVAFVAERDLGSGTIAVVDAGTSGTDLAIIDVVGESLHVRRAVSLPGAGAHAIDDALAEQLAEDVVPDLAPLCLGDEGMREAMRRACREARRRAARDDVAVIAIPELGAALPDGSVPIWSVTAQTARRVSEPCFSRIVGAAHRLLLDTDTFWTGVDHLVLVGGLCSTPALRARLEDIFACAAARGVDEEASVAKGTALVAAWSQGRSRRQLVWSPARTLRSARVAAPHPEWRRDTTPAPPPPSCDDALELPSLAAPAAAEPPSASPASDDAWRPEPVSELRIVGGRRRTAAIAGRGSNNG